MQCVLLQQSKTSTHLYWCLWSTGNTLSLSNPIVCLITLEIFHEHKEDISMKVNHLSLPPLYNTLQTVWALSWHVYMCMCVCVWACVLSMHVGMCTCVRVYVNGCSMCVCVYSGYRKNRKWIISTGSALWACLLHSSASYHCYHTEWEMPLASVAG